MCMNWTEGAVHGAQPAHLGILPGYSFELAGEILNPLAKDVDLIKGEPDNLPYGVRHIRARLLHQAGDLLEVSRPLRDHHPELCQMATQGIDQLRALTDKALTGPEVDRACLVLGAFDGDAMNFRPHGSFGDCGRIGRIILLAFDEWLGVDWRDLPDIITSTLRETAPIMAGRACFHCHNSRRLRGQQLQQLRAGQS